MEDVILDVVEKDDTIHTLDVGGLAQSLHH